MSINSVLQTGVQGVQNGIKGVEQSAKEIVRASSSDSAGVNGLVEPIVDLKLYERSVEASSKVIKTADEVLGKLLDTMA